MEKCWANSLNGCEGVISGEHIVSKSLFKSTYVDVKGFSWCKDQEKRIGLASLTKKMLCEKHNAVLSPLDKAASHAFDVLRKQTKLFNEREKYPDKKFKKIIFSLNASYLERWLLKTLINFSYGGEYFIGPYSTTKGRPCETLVRIAYGMEKFKNGNGMFVAYKEGGNLNFKDAVGFSPIIADGKHIYGGKFTFRGVLLFLDISPEGIKVLFKDMPDHEPEWNNVYLSKRVKQIKAIHGNRVSHVVNFNWA